MRVVDALDAPRVHRADHDADLLEQLAPQRRLDRLARLDLAARELPVARVDLALGAAGEQEGAVLAHQHADGDFHLLAIRPALARPVAVRHKDPAHAGCRPAQSRANW